MHMENYGHKIDWKNLKIMDKRNPKNTRKFLEAWHPDQSSMNKHIEIDPTYQPIRKIMDKHRTKNQTNGRRN